MKNALSILAIFTMFGCQPNATPAGEVSSESAEQKTANGKNAISTRTYLSDPRYLTYDYQTSLKNGYQLAYRVYVAAESSDTLQTIFLMKGAHEIGELNGGSYGLPHKNIGYVGADFDSTFAFVQSFGSGNPHYFQLIRKSSGKELLKGTWVAAHEKEQVLLYLENEPGAPEQLKLYDLKNRNTILVTGFNASKCVAQAVGGLRNCVEIDTVTAEKILLKIDTTHEKIINTYNR